MKPSKTPTTQPSRGESQDLLVEGSLFVCVVKAKKPEAVIEVPSVVLDLARQTEKRLAYVKLGVPDEVVKNLKGAEKQQHLYFLIQVDREAFERLRSPIIQPELVVPK